MVLIGIGFLSASINGGFRLNRELPAELRGRWQLLTSFMVFFDVGYIGLALLLTAGIYYSIELLVGLILMLGAIFVFVSVKQTEFTVRRMNEHQQGCVVANQKLRASNDKLLEEVRAREKISAELRKSKTQIENIFNNSIPLCLTNKDFEIVDANEAYYRNFGKSATPVKQKCYESRPGSSCDTDQCVMARILSGEHEVLCKSEKVDDGGVTHRYLVTAKPLRDEDGEVVGIIESFQDITKLKLTEEALAEEKESLQVTLGSIADGVITVDLRGRVVLINDMAQAVSGWPQKYAVGRVLNDVLHLAEPHDRATNIDLVELLANILKGQSGEESERLDGQAVLLAKGGWERHIHYTLSPIHDQRGGIFGAVLVFQDITEKLKIEKESARIEKLESVSLLASGVAHDFNNILTTIMNNLVLARMVKDSGDKLLEKLDSTEEAVLKAKELTNQLLTFAKGGSSVKELVSIGDLVKNSVEFSLRGSNVSSDISVGEDLWPVEVDAVQMHQVISNLVINAAQAMPDGGILSVSLANCRVRPGESALVKGGRYVKLGFRDQGPGISEDLLGKVFDPYFTTKPEGSGLGLATVYSIISKHDGYVFVDSEEGRGAEFTICLPAAKGKGAEAASIEESGKIKGAGGKSAVGSKILIMDDEEDIRVLLSELLHSAGFKVVTARDGEEAIHLYREVMDGEDRFDCIIMDLTIPGGMGGREAISRLRQIDPGVRAIVSSGYANDPAMIDHKSYGFLGRIAKPYRLDVLIETLNEVVCGSGE
jgi:PAS domain S-box-containing protein